MNRNHSGREPLNHRPAGAAHAHGGHHKHRRKKHAPIGAFILMALALALAVFAAVFFARNAGRTADVQAMSLTYSTLVPQITAPPTPDPTPAPTAAPTPQPTFTPVPSPEPTPFDYLPVVYKAETSKKRVAITVDDCYQLENLKEIAALTVENGGRLTLFPIGQNLQKEGMAEVLQGCVYKLGFEIENHTWSHARIFKLSEQEMAEEIWKQRQALNRALKADYQQHFLRLMGGDGVTDQRTHNYMKQLGYLGIAGWSYSGSDAPLDKIQQTLSPGMIYLFHTTDADTEKLRRFIPWVKAQGYEMVTLNQLLGLPDNALSEYSDQEMPAPQHYDPDYHTEKKGDYTWVVLQLQEKLRGLGYLHMDGESTGYYGDKTAKAVAEFQKAQGLTATGEADAATLRALLG